MWARRPMLRCWNCAMGCLSLSITTRTSGWVANDYSPARPSLLASGWKNPGLTSNFRIPGQTGQTRALIGPGHTGLTWNSKITSQTWIFPRSLRRFNQCRDRSSTVRHSPVRPVCMDLIAFLLGFLESRREYDAASCSVGLHGALERSGVRQVENGLQHFNDVIEGVFLVVQDDDVIHLAQVIFRGVFDFRV